MELSWCRSGLLLHLYCPRSIAQCWLVLVLLYRDLRSVSELLPLPLSISPPGRRYSLPFCCYVFSHRVSRFIPSPWQCACLTVLCSFACSLSVWNILLQPDADGCELGYVAIFKSYPSIGDAALYMPLLLMYRPCNKLSSSDSFLPQLSPPADGDEEFVRLGTSAAVCNWCAQIALHQSWKFQLLLWAYTSIFRSTGVDAYDIIAMS
eukprot:750526-Hanusia_phi.AAC.1